MRKDIETALRRVPFYILLAASGAAYLGPMAIMASFTDWEHPRVKVTEKHTENGILMMEEVPGKKDATRPQIDVTVDWPTDRALTRWYAVVKSPVHFSIWQWMLLSAVLTILAPFAYVLSEKDADFNDCVSGTLWVLVPLCIGWCVLNISLAMMQDFDTALMDSYPDERIRAWVIQSYRVDRGIVICSLGGMLAFIMLQMGAWFVGVFLAHMIVEFVRDPIEEAVLNHAVGVRRVSHSQYLAVTDGVVELRRDDLQVRWWFWPLPVVKNLVQASLTLKEFWQMIREAARCFSADEIARRTANYVSTHFSGSADKVGSAYHEALLGTVRRALGARIESLRNGVVEKERASASALLQEASDKTLARFKEDLLAGAIETASEELAPFKKTVTESLRGRVIDTLKSGHGGSISTLLPHGTRFVASHGPTMLVVVEQEPMIRTVRWQADRLSTHLDNLESTGITVTPEMREKIKNPRFEIALPYLVYLLRFSGGKLMAVHIFCRTSPLRTVDDKLFVAPLPHLRHRNGEVCFGDAFKKKGNSIAELTEAALVSFWQSEFTYGHWAEGFDRARTSNVDLINLWRWEERSHKNPRFILEAQFETPSDDYAHSIATFWREISQSAVRSEVMTYDALVARAMEDGEAALRKVVREFFTSVSVDRRYVKTVEQALDDTLKNMGRIMVNHLEETVVSPLTADVSVWAARDSFEESLRRTVMAVLVEQLRERGFADTIQLEIPAGKLEEMVALRAAKRR